MTTMNPTGMDGIACVEFSAPDAGGLASLDRLFKALGFSLTRRHETQRIDLHEQNGVALLVNGEPGSFAARFAAAHGPCVSGLGLWVADADVAIAAAVARGAERHTGPTAFGDAPAIVGIGGSLVHFIDRRRDFRGLLRPLDRPVLVPDRGFDAIDHLTNNVEKGTMERWQRFYKEIFCFTEVRTFDIRGEKTGLHSYALRSPCGKFCIPINEGSEEKSQIEEYLREYRGPGVQHIALRTRDLLSSLRGLGAMGVETLDIDDAYYETVFDRVAGVREDHAAIQRAQVLVDGDKDGYLLQIFTRNVIGPIFFEMIQRENHLSFGEGNFGALFRSIERDQERRGVL
jgi:4-hydroxyphenylpyruvate dioxygenase